MKTKMVQRDDENEKKEEEEEETKTPHETRQIQNEHNGMYICIWSMCYVDCGIKYVQIISTMS